MNAWKPNRAFKNTRLQARLNTEGSLFSSKSNDEPFAAEIVISASNKGEMVVVERTPTRHAIRSAENDVIIVTNDYRMLDCPEVESGGEIYDTTCSRFNAANRWVG